MLNTILIGIVAFFGFLECGVGNSMIQRPIVLGPLIGIILGDVQTGLAVGATLELAFMGSQAIGAALPPEITAGGILGTAFAITSGSGADVAVALALPIATIALLVKNTYYLIIRGALLHISDQYAEKGNTAKVSQIHLFSYLSYAIVMAIIMALCFYAGGPAVEAFLAIIPGFVTDGLSVACGVLPALGFAMLANMLLNKKVAPFFIIGFVLAAYLNMAVLGIAILGVMIALIMVMGGDNNTAVEVPDDEDF